MFALLAAGVGLLAAFLGHEWRLPARGREPLLDLRLLTVATYRRGLLAGSSVSAFTSTSMFLITIATQIGLGLSPLAAGALFSVNAVGYTVASMVATRRPRISTAIAGGFLGIAGLLVMSVEALAFGKDFQGAYLIPALLLTGACQGAIIPQLTRLTLEDLRPELVSRGGAAVSTVQQAGGAMLVAVVGSWFFWIVADDEGRGSYARAFGITMFAVTAVLALAVVLLWRLRQAGLQRGARPVGHLVAPVAPAAPAGPAAPADVQAVLPASPGGG
jgi:hypothetical protein